MSINEILSEVEKEILGRRGEGFKSLFESQVAAAEAHLSEAQALAVGDAAPDFSLMASSGQYISLKDVLAKAPVVLTFYRGSWCNFCNAALKEWQNALPELSAKGAALLAIVPETPEICREYKEASELAYELLSDSNNAAADAYGLAFELPADARETLLKLNTDVGSQNGNGKWSVPVTATYVIGRDQRVRFADCGPDYPRRADTQEVIAALPG